MDTALHSGNEQAQQSGPDRGAEDRGRGHRHVTPSCADPPAGRTAPPGGAAAAVESTSGGICRSRCRRRTPHSLSRRVRDLLAGDLGDHREYPADPDAEHQPEQPAPVPVRERRVYSREDWQRAWLRRRADLDLLADVADVLTDIDQQVADLQNRVTALLDRQII